MVEARQGLERRVDPRTNRVFSLGNLLKTRAERQSWDVAIVGTRDGFLLASSRGNEDRFAHRAAAHVSAHLYAGSGPPGKGTSRFVFEPAKRPEVRLVGERVTICGQPVFLAVVGKSGELDETAIEDALRAVQRILSEPSDPGS
jgi:hypothetical protein